MSEVLLKGWLVHQLTGVWCDVITPGAGATMGFPDLGMLVPGTSLYVPMELKLAETKMVPGKTYGRSVDGVWRPDALEVPAYWAVRPHRLRSTQIAWHDGFTRAGGYSRLVLAAKAEAGWDVWVLDRPTLDRLKDYKRGFKPLDLIAVSRDGRLDVAAWWNGPLAWWREQVSSVVLGQPRPASQEAAGAKKKDCRLGSIGYLDKPLSWL